MFSLYKRNHSQRLYNKPNDVQTTRKQFFSQSSFDRQIRNLDLYNVKLPHRLVGKSGNLRIKYFVNFNKQWYKKDGFRMQFDVAEPHQLLNPKRINDIVIDKINRVILIKLAKRSPRNILMLRVKKLAHYIGFSIIPISAIFACLCVYLELRGW